MFRIPDTFDLETSKWAGLVTRYTVSRSRDLSLTFDGAWVVSEAFTAAGPSGPRITRVDIYVTTTRKYVVVCTRSEAEREPLVTGDAFEDFGEVVEWLGRDNKKRGLGHAGTAAVTAAVAAFPMWLSGANEKRV